MTWQPTAGDPTIPGWTITAGYFLAATLCANRGRQYRRSDRPGKVISEKGSWYFLAAVTLALGLNKQLDLQSLLFEWGRNILRGSNLFNHRRTIQKIFCSLLLLTGLGFTVYSRQTITQFALARPMMAFGFLIVTAAICLRIAEANHLTLPSTPFLGENSPWWLLELAGLTLMIKGSLRRHGIAKFGC